MDIEVLYGKRFTPALANRPWVRDGVDELEGSMIVRLRDLVNYAGSDGERLLGLPFLNSIEPADARTLDVMSTLAAGLPQLFLAVLQTSWVEDGLSEDEIEALSALERLESQVAGLQILESVGLSDVATLTVLVSLAELDSNMFKAVVGRPWFYDGLDEAEAVVLRKLGELANRHKLAELWIATYAGSSGSESFIEDSVIDLYDVNGSGAIEHAEMLLAVADYRDAALNEDELLHIIALYGFSEGLVQTPRLMELVMATGWYQDGITDGPPHTERKALRALKKIDLYDTEVAKTILGWPWIFDERLVSDEASVLEYLSEIDGITPELSQLIVSLPWLSDSINDGESTATSRLYELVMAGLQDYAVDLASAAWVTDGVTLTEVLWGIGSLSQIAISRDAGSSNPQAARQIMGLLRYPPDFIDLKLTSLLRYMREHVVWNLKTDMRERRPDRLDRLFTEPWFADGLDQKERIYLIAAIASDKDVVFEPYTMETKAIELPLAGPVNLWVVGHDQYNSQNTIVTMEQAVRGSERFWGIPFPVEHVILYVRDPGRRGQHIGYMMFLNTHDEDVPQSTMFHEVAHYYFHVGPRWFREGGATVVEYYISAEGNLPDPVFPEYCAEQGLKNLQDWTELGSGALWDSCSYGMGLHFLLTLRNVMGGEGWLSALRALYLEYGTSEALYLGSSVDATDEDIYRAFLEHTPSDLVEEVNEVFRRLHGGPFISQSS